MLIRAIDQTTHRVLGSPMVGWAVRMTINLMSGRAPTHRQAAETSPRAVVLAQ